MNMKWIIWLCACLALPALAEDYSRSALPAENGFSYVLGNGEEHWQGGQVNWYYNPTNQPSALSTADVVALIDTATAKWAGMCNLTFNYKGTTTTYTPNIDSTWSTIDRVNVIGWAALTGDRAGYDGYTKWWYASGGLMADADIVLNTASQTWTQSNKQSLEALITHELGHLLGLNHSNIQFAVMAGDSITYNTRYNTYSFQRTLRGDDAQACAALYGAAPYAESNRLFNWVEVGSPYSGLFAPAVQPSATIEGYYYRFYPTTNSALGTKDGDVWYLDPNGQLINVGPISNYLGAAYGAGF